MLTEAELALIERLGECHTEYVRLVNDAEAERPYGGGAQIMSEFASRIHDLQARVMWLGARRAHPGRLR